MKKKIAPPVYMGVIRRHNAYLSFIYGEGVPKIDIIVAESAAPGHINYQFRSPSNRSLYPYSKLVDRIEPIFELKWNKLSQGYSLRFINPAKWPLLYSKISGGSFVSELCEVLHSHGITSIQSDNNYDLSFVEMINSALEDFDE